MAVATAFEKKHGPGPTATMAVLAGRVLVVVDTGVVVWGTLVVEETLARTDPAGSVVVLGAATLVACVGAVDDLGEPQLAVHAVRTVRTPTT